MNNNRNNRSAPAKRQGGTSSNNTGINISYNTVCLVLCLAFALVNLRVFSLIITSNDTLKAKIAVPVISEEEQRKIDEQERIKKDIEENFITIPVSFDDTRRGNLILVNDTHEYSFDAISTVVADEQAITIPDSSDASYWVKSNYDLLKPNVLENIDRLLCDFAIENNNTDVMILDTFRSYEDQQRVLANKIEQLGEQQGRKIATNPGFSEHHTCLAIDLTLFNGKEYGEYDGQGIYKWITDNCKDYGFVIRYGSDKTDITGIDYEPWHLRYVGNEHAYYMTQNNLCLEEYITLLSQYTVDGQRLKFTDGDGNSYSVYSCVVGEEGGTVHVPRNGSYTLSGDNDGRIIVTCKTSY
ncbi:MAG: M15 family metallopeptidase [Clostridia bacterium]|nr:M15 family metallopeptidase [Clostridia bacterium]